MRRLGIIAWVAVLVLQAVGCAPGMSESPRDRADPPATVASAGATGTHEPTTSPPPDERTAHDPPTRPPQKQAGLFFPQFSGPVGMSPQALGGGRLFVRDRCIHMALDGDGGDVVVWPYGYSPRREGGEVVVLNGREEVVAKVGEEVRMGGGQITREEAGPTPETASRAFEEKRRELGVPDRCRGPLWMSSGVVRG